MYVVAGRVMSPDSAGVAGLRVILQDCNLAADPTILARGETDGLGRFTLSAEIDSRYLRERGKSHPDVQAAVLLGNELIARSEVRYSASQRESDMNVRLPAGLSALGNEHGALTAAIGTLHPGDLGALREDDSRRDISYLANRTGWDARAVAMATQAARLSSAGGEQGLPPVDPDLYYALFRAGAPAEPTDVHRVHPARAFAAWQQAIDQNVIGQRSADELAAARTAFTGHVALTVIDAPPRVGISTVGELLAPGLDNDRNQMADFVDLVIQFDGDEAGFERAAYDRFGNTGRWLLAQGELASLTLNNGPLIAAVRARQDATISSLADLVDQDLYFVGNWGPLLDRAPIPAEITGGDDAGRRAVYAQNLAAALVQRYPTRVVSALIAGNHLPGTDADQPMTEFLNAHRDDFVFGVEPIGQYIERKQLQGNTPTAVVDGVARLQRVWQLTDAPEELVAMMATEVDSSLAVTQFQREAFIDGYGDDLGGADVAQRIYDRADTISTTVSAVVHAYLAGRAAPVLGSSGGLVNPLGDLGSLGWHPIDPPLPWPIHLTPQATLTDLFGSLDYGTCTDCHSVTSPAAYLVDLLDFIDHPAPRIHLGPWINPQATLFARRPDIETLALTCANTNTALPYIDLVNETLAYYVSNKLALTGYTGHDTADTDDSADLIASPPYGDDAIMQSANTVLQQTWGPAPLPFHRELDMQRQLLASLNVDLASVMAAVNTADTLNPQGPPPAGYRYAWRDVLAEELGISRPEYTVLTNHALPELSAPAYDQAFVDAGLGALYAFAAKTSAAQVMTALTSVREVARRLDLTLTDLASILTTSRFLNPGAGLIPLAQALQLTGPLVQTAGWTLEKLKELHDGLIAGTITPGEVVAALPPNLDTTPYGGDVAAWLTDPKVFDPLMRLILITAPDPGDTSTMELHYANPDLQSNPIDAVDLVRLARFVRLWRKLDLSIDATDRLICALLPPAGPPPADQAAAISDLDTQFLTLLPRIAVTYRTAAALGLDPSTGLDPVLALWTPMTTAGPTSLYARLFLPATAAQDPQLARNKYGDVLTAGNVTLAAAKPALCAGMRLTANEFDVITGPGPGLGYAVNTALTLPILTDIYRRGFLARALRISVGELLHLRDRTGIEPFGSPDWPTNPPPAGQYPPAEPDTLRFIALATAATSAAGSLTSVLYQLWDDDFTGKLAPPDQSATALAGDLRDAFAAIDAQFTIGIDPPDPATVIKLLTAAMGPSDTQLLMSALNNTLITSVDYPQGDLPAALVAASNGALSYDDLTATLSYAGWLDPVTVLPNLYAAAPTQALKDALTKLSTECTQQMQPLFDRYPDLHLRDVTNTYRDQPDQRPALLRTLIAEVATLRKQQQALTVLSADTGTDPTIAAALLTPPTPGTAIRATGPGQSQDGIADLLAMGNAGLTQVFNLTNNPPAYPPAPGDPHATAASGAIDFGPGDLPHPQGGAAGIAALWCGALRAPTTGAYKVQIVAPQAASVSLTVGGRSENGDTVHIRLAAGALTPITITATGITAGPVQLRWITTGSGWQTVPASALFSATLTNYLAATARRYRRIATLATGLNISAPELLWLATRSDLVAAGTPSWVNLPATAADNPKLTTILAALTEYAALKNNSTWPSGSLLSLVQYDSGTNDFDSAIQAVTGWAIGTVTALRQRLTAAGALPATVVLTRMSRVADLVRTTGLDPAALTAAATNDPTAANTVALQGILRSRHTEEDWRDVITPINDALRIRQRDALVTHILTQANTTILEALGIAASENRIATTEDLFSYFLFDVQMQPCMKTSRIRLALSSVQTFIERSLAGLEPGITAGRIDPNNQWWWRKTYRVWQARWEVWAWPENVMDVAVRDDQSAICSTALSALQQGDPDDDAKAAIYLNYLSDLEQIAKLVPTGLWYETGAGGGVKTAHIVARNHNAKAQQYYYCRHDGLSWTPWQQIPLKIDSDVNVVPYVWNNRIMLLWTKIHANTTAGVGASEPKVDEPNPQSQVRVADVPANQLLSNVASAGRLAAMVQYSAALSFSHFYNNKWQPIVTADNNVDLGSWRPNDFDNIRSALRFEPFMTNDNSLLNISISTTTVDQNLHGGTYALRNTHSCPQPGVLIAPQIFSPSGRVRIPFVFAGVSFFYDTSYKGFEVVYSDGDSVVRFADAQPDAPDPWTAPFSTADDSYTFYITPQATPFWILPNRQWPALLGLAAGDLNHIPPVSVPFVLPPNDIRRDPITALQDQVSARGIVNAMPAVRGMLTTVQPFALGGRAITTTGSVTIDQLQGDQQ